MLFDLWQALAAPESAIDARMVELSGSLSLGIIKLLQWTVLGVSK